MHFLLSVLEFIYEALIVGIIWKVIIAHALADYIKKYVMLWLKSNPDRLAHYESVLKTERRKLSL